MNGILIINKEKNYTSRDIVNIIGKILGTKKIGHTGTLDPIATGVLVLCIGKSLKLVELLTNHDKEYIATLKLGIETDTLDITGNIIKNEKPPKISKEEVEKVLKTFIGKIEQEVPKYSAIKVKGKKLYEYARNGEEVILPKRKIEIYDIQLISIDNDEIKIKCHVSKGTYIRSLIRDIGYALNTYGTMTELKRTKLGNFNLEEAYSIKDVERGNYKLLSPLEVLNLPKITVDNTLEKKVKNGQVLPSFFKSDKAFIVNKEGILLAIYQKKDNNLVKPYRMF